MIITRPSDLERLVARLREHDTVALDTEFERERTYWPKLQLIQVAVPGEVAAVDPLAIRELGPLLDLVNDPSIRKVTHAGRQDAEIFWNITGAPPQNLYDTQIAAALVGLGEQTGYASLVQRLLKVRLKKTERVTDWGRRPLSDSQVQYALDDVRYLLEITRRLDERLQKLGRETWLREELAFYAERSFYEQDPESLWMRVSGWRALDRRGLAVLRELARWREQEAAARDIPRNRVVPDDVLVEIGSRRPAEVSGLTPLRRLHPREIERNGRKLVRCVEAGMAVPEEDLPRPPRGHHEDPETALAADLLGVLLRLRARESHIAPSYLGNQKAVARLVSWLAGSRQGEAPPLLHGWRHELVGRELVALYEGKFGLFLDTESGRVALEPRETRD